jgi:hypothetical protein
MPEQLRELAEELRENWDNGYWWADHQLLQAALVGVVLGALSLLFKYLELRMTHAMAIEAA